MIVAPQIGTRQLVNNRYGVCVRMALGYCSIEWSQVDRFSFSVSGDTGSFDSDIIGTNLVAESGASCTNDFVIIPDPRENGVPTNTDRFCGNGFITKTCKYNGAENYIYVMHYIIKILYFFQLLYSGLKTIRALRCHKW